MTIANNTAEAIHIYQASTDDIPQILHFVRELADYEHAVEEAVATPAQLQQALFGEHPSVWAILAEFNGEVSGFALYFLNFSTWTGRHGLYLEDLYVSPQYRGYGIGKALLQRLAQIAVERNCARFEWNVLDWNTPAIAFYQSVGAQPLSEWTGYRLSGDALMHFAKD
ncbi:MAG: GNAT family N-acetyltransferase [Parahaliea sp.]